jgi:valyl-tRNA synthetase
LLRLQQLTEVLSEYLDAYRFSEAADAVYHFVWDELADWYIEASKVNLNKGVLAYVLEAVLKLAHPFAPFVTETIWQTLKWEDSLLAVSPWPAAPPKSDKPAAASFESVKAVVSELRFIAAALPASRFKLLYTANPKSDALITLIKALGRLEAVTAVEAGQGLKLSHGGLELWLDLSPAELAQFGTKLKQQIKEGQASIKRLEARLEQKSYIDNAPAALVAETRRQLEEAKASLAKSQQDYERFN